MGDGESHRIRGSGTFDPADYSELVDRVTVRRGARVPERCPGVVLRVWHRGIEPRPSRYGGLVGRITLTNDVQGMVNGIGQTRW